MSKQCTNFTHDVEEILNSKSVPLRLWCNLWRICLPWRHRRIVCSTTGKGGARERLSWRIAEEMESLSLLCAWSMPIGVFCRVFHHAMFLDSGHCCVKDWRASTFPCATYKVLPYPLPFERPSIFVLPFSPETSLHEAVLFTTARRFLFGNTASESNRSHSAENYTSANAGYRGVVVNLASVRFRSGPLTFLARRYPNTSTYTATLELFLSQTTTTAVHLRQVLAYSEYCTFSQTVHTSGIRAKW